MHVDHFNNRLSVRVRGAIWAEILGGCSSDCVVSEILCSAFDQRKCIQETLRLQTREIEDSYIRMYLFKVSINMLTILSNINVVECSSIGRAIVKTDIQTVRGFVLNFI